MSDVRPLAAMAPADWARTLGAPVLDTRVGGLIPVTIRHWQGVAHEIEQAALDHHFVSMHLGGSKRLFRRGEGECRSRDVPSGAYSLVPAGAAFHWDTEGPIDFMHVYFAPALVGHVVGEAFDRDPLSVRVQDALGESSPLIAALATSLLAELEGNDRQQAYLDDILHLLLCTLLRTHSNVRASPSRARHALAPYRLRRAKDFVEANLAMPIGVAEMAAAAGISQYHFSRAFRHTTGLPPYAYLLKRRIIAAKAKLADQRTRLTRVATQCGFSSLSQFSRMFKREVGVSPSQYRERR